MKIPNLNPGNCKEAVKTEHILTLNFSKGNGVFWSIDRKITLMALKTMFTTIEHKAI